jgi:hypothetical protein
VKTSGGLKLLQLSNQFPFQVVLVLLAIKILNEQLILVVAATFNIQN